MTQQQTVLAHLIAYQGITSQIAFHKYNITRLADVVFKLRKRGNSIKTIDMNNGKGTLYAKYVLEKAS